MSAKFQNFMRSHSIEHEHTTAYHPQGNGLVERLAGMLKTMLRQAMVDKLDSQLDEHLVKLVYAYNTSVQET